MKNGIVEINAVNLRDYTHDRHQTVRKDDTKVILTGPRGEQFSQKIASELAQESHLVIVCGHYEGVDERVRKHLVDREISIGDYILTSGNLPAMVMCDALVRLMPGALGCDESDVDESFSTESGFLEYPQYTRPADFRGWTVPDVLLSGNHALIEKWRRNEAFLETLRRRPDLALKNESKSED